MIKAVFFDFGGTLMSLGSDKIAHYHLMESVKNRYNLNENVENLLKEYTYYTHSYPSPIEYGKAFGKGNAMNAFTKILKNNTPDYEWFWDEHMKIHKKYVRLYPGAVETLGWVKKNSFHLGMISDIDGSYLYEQLKALNINNIFDSITTSEEAGFRKPDKRIFNKALRKAECTGNESIYIGDKIDRDIAGGKNVGMKTILFSNSNLNNSDDCPDFIIDKLDNVPDIVKKMMK